MNLHQQDVKNIHTILMLCKSVGIDSCVFTGGKVMGVSDKRTVAIISETELKLDAEMRLGVGRIGELEKRIGLFSDAFDIDVKSNSKNDVTLLTISAGRSKAQFRCTSASMISYPKENADSPSVVVAMKKDEVTQLTRAIKTFGSENVVIRIDAVGTVTIEGTDASNDQFSTSLETGCEFDSDPGSAIFTYGAPHLCTVLEVAAKDEPDGISLVFGEAGSITAFIKGHSILVMPNINEE